MAGVECAYDGKHLLGESPVWNDRDKALYWVDIYGPTINRLDPSTGKVRTWTLPDPVGSIGLRARNGLVAATKRGFHFFDIETGTVANERVFVDTKDRVGRPDGSTVDAEDCLWNAEYGGGRICRYTPDGRLDRVIEMPVTQPTSCAFGGAGLETLYITTARQRLNPQQIEQQPLAGALFAVRPGVSGVPEPSFAG